MNLVTRTKCSASENMMEFQKIQRNRCDGEKVRRKKLTHELSNTERVVVKRCIASS